MKDRPELEMLPWCIGSRAYLIDIKRGPDCAGARFWRRRYLLRRSSLRSQDPARDTARGDTLGRWAVRLMRMTDLSGRLAASVMLLALVLAPVFIVLTHGPTLPMDAASTTDAQLHGQAHDEPELGRFGAGHDATDHEHQTQAMLDGACKTVFAPGAPALGMTDVSGVHRAREGPRRPPRQDAV